MTIPAETLRLSFDPDELTLDEMSLFMERDATFRASVFKDFITKYGNWSKRQINGLVRKDVLTVYEICIAQIVERLTPKVNGGSS